MINWQTFPHRYERGMDGPHGATTLRMSSKRQLDPYAAHSRTMGDDVQKLGRQKAERLEHEGRWLLHALWSRRGSVGCIHMNIHMNMVPFL